MGVVDCRVGAAIAGLLRAVEPGFEAGGIQAHVFVEQRVALREVAR